MKKRVLLIEDEEAIAIPLGERLTREGYEVETVADGQRGYALAVERPFAVVILDLMLPLRNGLEVCREIRQQGIGVPIVMLTAKTQVPDRIAGLKAGADDYVIKPFDAGELLARLEVLLRRVELQAHGRQSFQLGGLRIDLKRGEVWRDGGRVALSPKEFQLLRFLVEHADTVVSREELLHEVWSYDGTISTRTVDTHIGWLRQKLEADPKRPHLIKTVFGAGYKLARCESVPVLPNLSEH